MTKLTRGFAGRGGARRDPRPPPGQYDAGRSWPVLTAESTPHLDTYTRTYTVEAFVQKSTMWCWEQLRALPQYAGDVHGATTSSKLGMTFTGVSVDTLLSAAKPLADATPCVGLLPRRSRTGQLRQHDRDGHGRRALLSATSCRCAPVRASRPRARSSTDLRSAVRRFLSAEV